MDWFISKIIYIKYIMTRIAYFQCQIIVLFVVKNIKKKKIFFALEYEKKKNTNNFPNYKDRV